MSEEELVIDDSNFDEYFHDVRKTSPQEGEVMVCYSQSAEFVEGTEKRHMIQLLKMDGKIEPATQVMRKLLFACDKDAIRVPKEMLKDMVAGMTDDEVAEKPYDYTVEMYFYTKPEYLPEDDPHWTQITIVNMEDFLARQTGEADSPEESGESNDNGEC
jgi:hypothetical protein